MSLDDPFFPALVTFSNAVGVPPDWFLNIFYLESRLQPEICNEHGYCGLNQMASKYLLGWGINPSDYRTWSASRQLTQVIAPWYGQTIRDFLGKVPRSKGVLYALNLYPAALKKHGDNPDSAVIDGHSSGADERAAYEANKGLDVNKDGVISIGDLDRFLDGLTKQAPYQRELARLETITGGPAAPGTTELTRRGWVAPALVVGVLVGGAAVAAKYL